MASPEKFLRHGFRKELRAKFLGVDLCRLTERAGENVGERARACGNKAAHRLAAIVGETDDVTANVLAAHPRGVSGADQRTDRGAGDRDRLYPDLVERLDDGNMGETARAAGT